MTSLIWNMVRVNKLRSIHFSMIMNNIVEEKKEINIFIFKYAWDIFDIMGQ